MSGTEIRDLPLAVFLGSPNEPRASVPDVAVDVAAVGEIWEPSFPCPWGCTDRQGKPHRHRHGGGRIKDGPPELPYGGRASHCRQPGAPSSYTLVPRSESDEG